MTNELSLLFITLFSANVQTVTLSFDDGPHPKYTAQILDILKKNDIKANFFLVGKNVKQYPDLVKREVAEGHQIGGHSMTHKELTKIPLAEATEEILDSMLLVNKFQKSDLFRFPYGAFNSKLKQIVKENGYRDIFWDIDSLDWKYHDSDKICSNVTVRITKKRDGAIILMHDIHSDTIPALKEIAAYLKQHNIKTKKLDD